MVASPQQVVAILLVAIGVGFLLANLRIGLQLFRFKRLRPSALLTWPGRGPSYPRLLLVMGIVLAFVITVKLVVLHRLDVFGESMMLLYYVHLVPLGDRIGRGFYRGRALAGQRLPALRGDRRPDVAGEPGADARRPAADDPAGPAPRRPAAALRRSAEAAARQDPGLRNPLHGQGARPRRPRRTRRRVTSAIAPATVAQACIRRSCSRAA